MAIRDFIFMDLKDGRVIIKTREELAPKTVQRIRHLVRNNFYDDLVFHRVIEGFMAQGGCPFGTGQGSSGVQLTAEFSEEPFVQGTVAMARGAEDVNSASCQFFICLDRVEHLDNNYTIWGDVVEGMEFVDNIKKGDPKNGAVVKPDRIVKMSLAEETPIKVTWK